MAAAGETGEVRVSKQAAPLKCDFSSCDSDWVESEQTPMHGHIDRLLQMRETGVVGRQTNIWKVARDCLGHLGLGGDYSPCQRKKQRRGERSSVESKAAVSFKLCQPILVLRDIKHRIDRRGYLKHHTKTIRVLNCAMGRPRRTHSSKTKWGASQSWKEDISFPAGYGRRLHANTLFPRSTVGNTAWLPGGSYSPPLTSNDDNSNHGRLRIPTHDTCTAATTPIPLINHYISKQQRLCQGLGLQSAQQTAMPHKLIHNKLNSECVVSSTSSDDDDSLTIQNDSIFPSLLNASCLSENTW